MLKNSAIVVKIPNARTDPWPETPDIRVIYFVMFCSLPLNVERIQGAQYSYVRSMKQFIYFMIIFKSLNKK